MHRSLGIGLTGRLSQLRVKKCAIPHEECRRGAHLPSLGREPVGGLSTVTFPVAGRHRFLTGTKFYYSATELRVCEQFA